MKLFCNASRPKSRLSAALTGRWAGEAVLAEERRIDRRAVVGEADQVLGRCRLLARGAAELALDADELLEQIGRERFRLLGQAVLDAGPIGTRMPLPLEAVGRRVDQRLLATQRLTHANAPSESGVFAPQQAFDKPSGFMPFACASGL